MYFRNKHRGGKKEEEGKFIFKSLPVTLTLHLVDLVGTVPILPQSFSL